MESTRKIDLHLKLKLYAKFQVPEYWIADLQEKQVAVHRLGETGYSKDKVFSGSDHLTSPPLPGLRIPLAEIFKK